MTKLPALSNWESTSHSLHKAAQLLGALRMLVRDPVPNYLELALRIEPNGLSTDVMPSGDVVLLDFQQAALVYSPRDNQLGTIPLAGQSQASLLEALLSAMSERGRSVAPISNPGQSYTAALFAALDARGHRFKPNPSDLTDELPLEVDPNVSAAYSEVLYRVFTAIARFRARLTGPMTPIVVWPEHFDLSFLWFATERATDEFPHMNFGFAPFDDQSAQPYLYAYAYPMPEGFERLPLPSLAQWHTEGWKGVVVPYDELARLEDPEAEIERICAGIYEVLMPTLR